MKSIRVNPNDFTIGDMTTYKVGALQAAANRSLKKLGDQLLKEYGISSMQWHIIGSVLDAGKEGARISDLAQSLDTTLPFLTNNVNLLESKGILERKNSSSDGRSRLVTVSAKFLPVCKEIEINLRAKLRDSLYSKVTPEELHTYLKTLIKFSEID